MFVLPSNLPVDVMRRLRLLAESQDGVMRTESIEAVGVTDTQVDRMVAARRWQADASGLVVIMHNGPLTRRQQEAVAVLAGGRVCALAARTAAASAGLSGWDAPLVEVVVPRGTTYPELCTVEVKVHESRRFGAADIHPTAWPPRVRIERALVDAATWSRRPRTAVGVLAAGVQQGLTRAERLSEELDKAGKVKWYRLLSSCLVDIGGGAHAVSEIDFIKFCARNGLPKPVHQVVRRDSKGRRRYLDATLVGPSGVVVRVEIDGALHLVVQTYWDDMFRGNELNIARELSLRLPSFVIYADDEEALAQLRVALGLSGPGEQEVA